MMETSAATPPTTDPKWLLARRADGAGRGVSSWWIPARSPVRLPTVERDVCREMGLVRAPASGCVPGQSASLSRTKRQRLKFQEGSDGGRCVTWHDTATVPPRDSLISIPIGLQWQSPECVSCPGWTEDVQKSGGFWSLCSLQMHQFIPGKLQMWGK